ncbi:MAG: signal peptide peptidase SppA [Muribaculaceae bacterium]|nr:signal peptide peptidase SppA [Muribaculaceae bacterium]
MLKRFFLNILSSFVGAWIALLLVAVSAVFLVMGVIGNFAISSSKEEKVESRSILRIDLSGAIVEREMPTEPELMSIVRGDLDMPQTLENITLAIREAADNDDIVAIYLKCGSVSAGPATLDAIRRELADFKVKTEGHKKIIAYAESFTQGAYFVGSVADCIYMNPAGELGLKGLTISNFFFKELLDKLGVQFQVAKVGTYKSAVEPYILDNMSEPARAQLDTLLWSMWDRMRQDISDSRKDLSPDLLDSLINKEYIAWAKPQDAVKAGLIDSLAYERHIFDRLAQISGREVKKLNYVSPSTLVSINPWGVNYDSNNQIAVLYAVGEIADGNNNQINYEKLVPVIQDLAENDKVKGMVLRVNSPGGSVFGSDQIGEALDFFKSKGKSLVVSMGDYAASGGYWISAKADRIFADPLTITGSIGIFGLIPNFKGTLDMIGVNVSSVSTNPDANFPTGFKPMDEVQMAHMQAYVERGYDQFVSRVASGRKMKKEQVLKIAEGRVWAAPTALKIGLVDQLGYLDQAIEYAAKLAKIPENYNISAYPQVEPNFWSLIRLNSMTIAEFSKAINAGDRNVLDKYILSRIASRNPVQARMPEFTILL